MCPTGMLQTDKISQQPENCENRNDPDLVQAFLKKWWVESDFKPRPFESKGTNRNDPDLAQAFLKKWWVESDFKAPN
jgi:hypothetical protein